LIFILLVTGFIYSYYLRISALPEWYTENKSVVADSPTDTVVFKTHSIRESSVIDDTPEPVFFKVVSETLITPALEPTQVLENDQTIIKPSKKKQFRVPKPQKTPSKSKRSSRQTVAKQTEPIEITTTDIPDLIYDQVNRISNGQARQLLKAVRSNISPQAIDVEMIVDVHQMQSLRNISGPELHSLMKLINTSNLNELYLQFNLIPIYRNNMITLKSESTIKIGKVLFELREMESQFGIKVDQFQLPAPGFSKLKLQRGKIILK